MPWKLSDLEQATAAPGEVRDTRCSEMLTSDDGVTFRCQLPLGHDGSHRVEWYQRDGE